MSTNVCRLAVENTKTKQVCVFMILLLLSHTRELQGQASIPENVPPPARPELVVLMDTDADQEKVFAVEQSLALDVVQRLGEKGFFFSLISFGVDGSRQIESGTGTGSTLYAIRNLTLEPGDKKKVAPPKLYEVLLAEQAMFSHDASKGAVLVISGGRDDLDGKRYKQIKSWFRTQKVVCQAAVVTWHSLYGTKGIQMRGFYLHDVARKTHGKYVELGRNEKKVQPAVQKLSRADPARGKNNVR